MAFGQRREQGVVWKLYYDDRTTFSNQDGEWLDAPPWGVMAVAVADEYAARTIDKARDVGCGDYYIWAKDAPQPWWADCGGLLDHLLRVGVMAVGQSLSDIPVYDLIGAGVKFGRAVDDEKWAAHSRWIVADADETFGFPRNARRRPAPAISG